MIGNSPSARRSGERDAFVAKSSNWYKQIDRLLAMPVPEPDRHCLGMCEEQEKVRNDAGRSQLCSRDHEALRIINGHEPEIRVQTRHCPRAPVKVHGKPQFATKCAISQIR